MLHDEKGQVYCRALFIRIVVGTLTSSSPGDKYANDEHAPWRVAKV